MNGPQKTLLKVEIRGRRDNKKHNIIEICLNTLLSPGDKGKHAFPQTPLRQQADAHVENSKGVK